MVWQTVPQVAESLGVDADKIIKWIAAGELLAVNIAQRTGGRPRWRISSDALAAFLASRQSTPPAPPPTRRRKQEAAVTRYF